MPQFKKLAVAVVIAALTACPAANAQSRENAAEDSLLLRPVTSAYSLEAGGAKIADTYLSPIIYRGWNIGFDYTRMQAMGFSPEKWVMQLRVKADGGRTLNMAGNAVMWNASVGASWTMWRRWKPVAGLTVAAGGYTGIDGGIIYLARNGNNPASAKASWQLGISAYATYMKKFGKTRTLLRWQGAMPLTGIFFSPAYGELYYEIYLGNRSGLVHGAWPGNFRQFDNEVTVDIELGSTWLRLGYRSHVLSTRVNDITNRVVTNSAIVGITTEWISIRPDRLPGKNARVISALY